MMTLAAVSVMAFSAMAEVSVVDCGAAVGNSPAANAAAIQKAIDEVSAAGGGRVVVPAGEFSSGTIWLKRRVNLHLERGAVLKASGDFRDYNADDAYPENFGITNEYWRGLHFIIAREADGSSITGEGTIHGNGDAFYDEKPLRYEEWMRPGAPAWWNGIRWAKDKRQLRPGQLIVFVKSDDVSVRGITIRNSPCWSLYFWGCRKVRVSDYTVRNGENDGNSDGIDFDCSRDVVLERADIDTGDDAIAVRAAARNGKLGREEVTDGVIIRNCRLRTTSTAIRFGVGTGIIRNVLVENVTCDRGGSPIMFMLSFGGKRHCCDFEKITVRNCRFANCVTGPYFLNVGTGGRFGLRQLTFENCRFNAKPHFNEGKDAKFHLDENSFALKNTVFGPVCQMESVP